MFQSNKRIKKTTLQSGPFKTKFIQIISREEKLMNITVTVGVTPELKELLSSLTNLLNFASKVPDTISQNVAPLQVVTNQPQQQPAPVQQQAPVPVQQPVPQMAPQVQQQAPVPQQSTAVPTSAPTYDINQLAVAATQLTDAGRINEIRQLLASFGSESLMQLPKEQYGAFATKLREMGAKI